VADSPNETPPEPPFDLAGRRALVIVPAFNEGEAIARVIRDLKRHAPWADTVVVNDGSGDATAEEARAAGVNVLDLPVNLGIGGAVQTGYRYAWGHGYDLAFQFDGDGQHRASLLTDLARPVLEDQADLVIGSRFLRPRGMTAYGLRLAGIKVLAATISSVLGFVCSPPSTPRTIPSRSRWCS